MLVFSGNQQIFLFLPAIKFLLPGDPYLEEQPVHDEAVQPEQLLPEVPAPILLKSEKDISTLALQIDINFSTPFTLHCGHSMSESKSLVDRIISN